MKSSSGQKRTYRSRVRSGSAEATRAAILDSARQLMSDRGIDAVTITAIAGAAKVSVSTIYAVFQSKEGILRALMEQSLFGHSFQAAAHLLADETDPLRLIALTAQVARAIYDGEVSNLGLLREASAFSQALRTVEQEFESLRFGMQQARIARLFAAGRQRPGLTLDSARRIMWMLTSRDVYRMLVIDGGWTPDAYEDWLVTSLQDSLLGPQSPRS